MPPDTLRTSSWIFLFPSRSFLQKSNHEVSPALLVEDGNPKGFAQHVT